MTWLVTFLLSFSIFLASAHSGLLIANDRETCIDLCKNCNGQATFEDAICNCSLSENDAKNRECLRQLQQKIEDSELKFESDESSERAVRRCMHSRRRMPSVDPHRVAEYFMKGGPRAGLPLESNKKNAAPSWDPIPKTVNVNACRPPKKPKHEKHVHRPVASPKPVTCSSPHHRAIVPSSCTVCPVEHRVIKAPAPAFYPQLVGSYPRMFLETPHNEEPKAFVLPSYHSGSASYHTPILSPIASNTHSFLHSTDQIKYHGGTERNNKVVGENEDQSNNQQSQSSNLHDVSATVFRDQTPISDSKAEENLIRENSFFESLKDQLRNYKQQVASPQIPQMRYATAATPIQYVFKAPQPIGQFVAHPTNWPVGQIGVHSNPSGRLSYPKTNENEIPRDSYSSSIISRDENIRGLGKRNTVTKKVKTNAKDEGKILNLETPNSSAENKQRDTRSEDVTVTKDQ